MLSGEQNFKITYVFGLFLDSIVSLVVDRVPTSISVNIHGHLHEAALLWRWTVRVVAAKVNHWDPIALQLAPKQTAFRADIVSNQVWSLTQ